VKLLSQIAAFAIAVVFSAPALAQEVDYEFERSEVGTRFLREPETADAQAARWMQKRIANCMFNRDEERIRELLVNSDFYTIDFEAISADPDEFFEDYEVSHCMGRVMRGRYRELAISYQYSTIRNLLAEEAYLHDYEGPPVIGEATPRDVAARFDGRRVHPQVSTMAALADCMVYEAPQDAHNLLSAHPGSDAEGEVIAALGPVIVGCANTRESELTIPTSLIRQIAADGLWSRSYYGSQPVETVAETAVPTEDWLTEFANCAWENEPAEAARFLSSSSSSAGMAAMGPMIAACGVGDSGTFDMNALVNALTAAQPQMQSEDAV